MANNRLNKIGILRIQLKKLYAQIDDCNGFQSVQLWGKVGDVKKKLRDLKVDC